MPEHGPVTADIRLPSHLTLLCAADLTLRTGRLMVSTNLLRSQTAQDMFRSISYGFRLICYFWPPVKAGQGFHPVPLSFQPAALCGERFLKISQRPEMPVL